LNNLHHSHPDIFIYFLKRKTPPISASTNKAAKRKNKNFAMAAAPTAICVNPKRAATSATARKINDQRNIACVL
jgi:hypothetical protein